MVVDVIICAMICCVGQRHYALVAVHNKRRVSLHTKVMFQSDCCTLKVENVLKGLPEKSVFYHL